VDSFLAIRETWVDPSAIPVPQGRESRVLANCLMFLADGVFPLPRLWYLPAGQNGAGDDTRDDSGYEAYSALLAAARSRRWPSAPYLHSEGDPNRHMEEWVCSWSRD